jgi:hypothetical protein
MLAQSTRIPNNSKPDNSHLYLGAFLLASTTLLLGLTFRLYRFAYFWLDDFNNLYWVQRESCGELMGYILNPAAVSFRPLGMFVYWILWHLWKSNPLPYHIVAWAIHTLNVFLVYLILSHLTKSKYAAAIGAMLFSFQGIYGEIFWSFGTIFELVSGLLYFISLWLYVRGPLSARRMVLIAAIYILAIKSKEMAITLPVVLLSYELLVRPRNHKLDAAQIWSLAKHFSILAIIAIWFTYLKVSTMAGMTSSQPYSPSHPYYMELSLRSLKQGYAWYFNAIFKVTLNSFLEILSGVLLTYLLVFKRDRVTLFFISYLLVSLLPIVIFPNHHYSFFLYLPFLGVCGLAAIIVKTLIGWIEGRLPPRLTTALGICCFALASSLHYMNQKEQSEGQRKWAGEQAREYESFVLGLRALPQPGPNETIYYSSFPQYFDLVTLQSATEVAFRRTDLKSAIAKEPVSGNEYRVRFQNPTVILEKPAAPRLPSNLD